MVYDARYGGIAAGVGTTYVSSLEIPALGEWVHIVATFSKSNGTAVVYRNGGILANGTQQTIAIVDDSGSVYTDVGLNGLRHYYGTGMNGNDHEIHGCFAQISLTNRVVSAVEVQMLYEDFDAVINSGQSMFSML